MVCSVKKEHYKFSFFISTYEILVFTIDLPPGENKCNITLNKIIEQHQNSELNSQVNNETKQSFLNTLEGGTRSLVSQFLHPVSLVQSSRSIQCMLPE